MIDSYPLNRYLLDQARQRRRDHQPFTYQGTVTFAAIGDQVMAIDMDSDAPFLWTRLSGEVFRAAAFARVQAPDIRLMIHYGGAGGRAWAQAPVHWRNVVSYRPVPYVLPFPKLMDRSSQIHVTLTADTDGDGGGFPQVVRLLFAGTKLFKWRAA
jgi:hypothetical protein